MTHEDIIRMAQGAGLVRAGDNWTEPARWGVTEIERFAALVAVHEREACAKVADEQAQDEPYGHAKFRCNNIAAAIRARK